MINLSKHSVAKLHSFLTAAIVQDLAGTDGYSALVDAILAELARR